MDGLQPMERKAPVYLNGLTQRAPDPRQSASGPWWWGLRVFKQSAWLEVGSVKMAWSHPGRAPGWCPIPPISTPEGAYPQGATQTQAVGHRNLDTIIHLKCVT